jgi:acyl phosphate:glycerol-3-phosphate acyltransferase
VADWTPNLIVFGLCYFIGGIPFGLLIGKSKGVDIRDHGSGNIGATNVLRTLGKRLGYLCFSLDVLKGMVPVLIACKIARLQEWPHQDLTPVFAVFAVVAGHVWCPFLKFKGGKGVATSAGGILAVAPIPTACSLLIWYLVFSIWRYVSLASIVAAAVLPLAAVVIGRTMPRMALERPTLVLLIVLAVLIIIKHRANIKRLLAGTESRFAEKGNAQ